MNTFYKTALATGISFITLFSTASAVQADGTSATPTPTSTPQPETRVECTTGAYGQQTCQTIVVQRTASPSGVPAHKVVNSGMSENITLVLIAVFALSSITYTYSKVNG